MRIPVTIFILCVIVIGFSGIATAHVGPTFYAQQVIPQAITIDGRGDDAGWNAPYWNALNTITTDLLGGNVTGGEMQARDDWDVVLKVGWSAPPDDALYFYCKVTDDILNDDADKNGDAWQDDSLEIIIDADHGGGEYGAVFPRGEIAQRFGIRASGNDLPPGPANEEGRTRTWLYGDRERMWTSGPPWMVVATETLVGGTSATYTYEGKMVMWDLAGDSPVTSRRRVKNEQGGTIGLTFQWNDVDGAEDKRRDLLGTQGPEGAGVWEDAGQSSDFLLIGDDWSPPPQHVWSIAFSPDRQLLAAADYTTIRLWNVAQRREVTTLGRDGYETLSVAFSPDGTLLASGGSGWLGYAVRLWDVAQHRELAVLEGHASAVRSVAFSPDGKLLASAGDDKTIRLWDLTRRQVVGALEGYTGMVRSVAFSPDGHLLASGGHDGWVDGVIRLWDVARQQEVAVLHDEGETVSSVVFSPDGKLLASASYGWMRSAVRLWNVAQGKEAAVLRGHTSYVRSVSFSPDGLLLASAGGNDDNTVRLWDVVRQEGISVLYGNTDGVWSVAFSPDGRLLAAGGEDGTVLWWDMQPTAVEDEKQYIGASLLPTSFSLAQNFPNPFNAETTISYALPEEAGIRVVVYDIAGHAICTLVDGCQQPGRQAVVWDGADERGQLVASGVYPELFTKKAVAFCNLLWYIIVTRFSTPQ